ncbi:DoxX family protein [Actinomadura coerulea]|uniref:DoxX family protein n=1 Tax=Actinomadura coerulea TaxID=46159 RepID=UPI00344A7C78
MVNRLTCRKSRVDRFIAAGQADGRDAAGLILPAAVGVAPVMVPVTAVCWVLLMVGAMVAHGRRGEAQFVALNLVYLALAVFIAVGRFGAW